MASLWTSLRGNLCMLMKVARFSRKKYKFPGKGGRAFDPKYFDVWPLISKLPAKDAVLCYACNEVISREVLFRIEMDQELNAGDDGATTLVKSPH